MILLLCVGLLAGLWQSPDLAHCQNLSTHKNRSGCYNRSSGKICFTTFLDNNSKPVRESFENASRWCNSAIPNSSLIIINRVESQRTAVLFIGGPVLQNETIVLDARKLSSKDARKKDQTNDAEPCVYSRSGQSLIYQFCYVTPLLRHICEFPGSRSVTSHQRNNKSYVAGEKLFTWYDARNECLRLGGDLASKTDLQKITDWSWLKENESYWIGPHIKNWSWNSTGAAVTYTNWDRGYPDESSDKECICLRCKNENNRGVCGYDEKWTWLPCNCNHSYAFVCQKGEASSDVTTEIYITGKMLSSSSEDFKSSVSLSNNTIIRPLHSFNNMEIFLTPFLVTTIFIIVAAILVMIKCRKYTRNNGSLMKKTRQIETDPSVYATAVPANIPLDGIDPSGNTIYADIEMTQRSAVSSNIVYASIQQTSEAVNMGTSVVYADLDIPRNTNKGLRVPTN